MSKLSVTDRSARVLRFLSGIGRSRRARTALARRGFAKEDYNEGWRLFEAATRIQFNSGGDAEPDAVLIGEIDAWENRWFPIAAATLERRYPAIHAFVFKNLAQAEGPAVIATVGTFHERITALEKPNEETKKLDGLKEARKVLTKRGLTSGVMDEARELLAQTKSWGGVDDSAQEDASATALEAAEAEMWGWYKEWSRILRVEVTSRVVLKQLGFLANGSAAGGSRGDAAGGDEEDGDESAPA